MSLKKIFFISSHDIVEVSSRVGGFSSTRRVGLHMDDDVCVENQIPTGRCAVRRP